MTFEAAVRTVDRSSLLDLVGDINRDADAALTAAFEEASAAAPEHVVLNFERVDYINSTGIALIVGVVAKARSSGVRLGAYGLSEHYRDIFAITRLAEFVSIFDDEHGALASGDDRGDQKGES